MRKLLAALPLLTLATLALTLGCLSSTTTRDADLVQVWPPKSSEDEPTSAPSTPATQQAAALKSSISDRPIGSALAAPENKNAIHDSRLTPQQQALLSAQLASWPQGRAPSSPAGDGSGSAPPQQTLSSYYASRVASAPNSQPSTPASTPAAMPTGAEAPAATPAAGDADASANKPAADGSATTEAAAEVSAGNKVIAETKAVAAKSEGEAATAAAESAPESKAEDAAQATAAATAKAEAKETAEPGASQSATPSSDVAKETKSDDKASESPGEWEEHLAASIASLERRLASAELEKEERVRLESTLRLMYVAAHREEDATRPIEDLNQTDQEFWKQCTFGLLQLIAPDGPPVASRRAKLALRPLREALQHLAALAPLDVRNLAICQKVESFGRYTEFTPYEFRPEQEVILYVEVSNFAVEAKADGYETEFHGSYQILDSAGRRIVDYDLMQDRQMCRNVRTDYFLPYRVYMPKNLSPGTYQLQVTIEDKKGQKFGQTPPVEFKITG